MNPPIDIDINLIEEWGEIQIFLYSLFCHSKKGEVNLFEVVQTSIIKPL